MFCRLQVGKRECMQERSGVVQWPIEHAKERSGVIQCATEKPDAITVLQL